MSHIMARTQQKYISEKLEANKNRPIPFPVRTIATDH